MDLSGDTTEIASKGIKDLLHPRKIVFKGMNAELFDEIIKNASFGAELFYDMKPGYYSFAGERKRLDSHFNEIK